jgi:hypothetical protein
MTVGANRHIRRLTWFGLLAVLIAVGACVHALLTGNWLWLAVAVFVLAGTQTSTVITASSLIVAVVTGAWPAAVAAGLALVPRVLVHAIPLAGGHSRFTSSALAEQVAALPPDLAERLARLGGGQVDTVVLLAAAIGDDSSRWPEQAARCSAVEGSEGGCVPGTAWTVVAAESVLVADQRPDRTDGVDVHLLAAIAAILPHSHAQAALSRAGLAGSPSGAVLGATPTQIGRLLQAAARRPGGELLMARVEMDVRTGARFGSLLDDGEWRRVGAPMSRGRDENG